jgi:hypothetical protein
MSLTKVTYAMIEGAYVNVLDYGADATGSTDSSAAFAAAAATGKTIYVPVGTYKAQFNLQSGQMVVGEGSKNKTVLIPFGNNQYVIGVNATSVAKQRCVIANLSIQNPNAATGCVGIRFQGTDVNSINDYHLIENVYIDSIETGIVVRGRQIWSTYINVEIVYGTTCFDVDTDATTPAFNQNVFLNCRFAACTGIGVKIVGQNTTLGFYTCDFEVCNSANTPGVAAVYIEDSEQASFIGCYWENNGSGVAVDTVTLANNSIGLHFAGTYCHNPKIEQAYAVTSGIMVWIEASIRGGIFANSRINPLVNGYALYVSCPLASITASGFTFDSSNLYTQKILILQDVNGQYAGRVNQVTSCYWMTAKETVDLIQVGKLIVNPNGTTFTGIDTINNRIPGMELWVWNDSASNSFTIDSSLIFKGSGVIAAQTGKRYMVGGFPANGKLIEM